MSNKTLKRFNLSKLAETLVEIADELDEKDPKLSSEVDNLLTALSQSINNPKKLAQLVQVDNVEDLLKNLQFDSKLADPEESLDKDEEDLDELGDMQSFEMEEDPDIVEINEPTPEYDQVSLSDLEERLGSMKWRVADKARKEALEKAKEHALKAKQYYKAFCKYRDKTHQVFDDAGEPLRLRSFEDED